MPLITRIPTRSYFITVLVVVSLLFVAFSTVIYNNYTEARRLNQWIIYNYEVIRQSRKIMIDLVDMETGVRGYLITGQKKFLQPYKESKITLKKQIEVLRAYTKDDPTIQDTINAWLIHIEKFSALLDSQINRYDTSIFNKTPTASMDKQKRQMDTLRAMLERYTQQRLDDLNEHLTREKEAENNFKYILGIGTTLAIGFMLVLTLVILALTRRSQAAEAESAAAESRFRFVMNGVNDGLFDYNLKDNSIYFSPEYKSMLGYEDHEVPNTIAWANSALHPDDAEQCWKILEDYRHKRIPTYRSEFRMRKKGGGWLWILSRGVGLFDSSGQLIRLIGTHTDITIQKQREEQLATLNKEMETFSYITSHDLRAPLVNLKGFSGELAHAISRVQAAFASKKAVFLESEYEALSRELEEDIPESLRFIVQSVEKMDVLTTAVLDLSRIGKRVYRSELVDTASIVQRCLDSLAYEISQKKIAVSCEPLPNVMSDALALEQIWSNVIDNAVKYLDPQRSGEIRIGARQTASNVIFSVADNGRGIAKSDHDKVFHIFRRARNSVDVRGSGLGMAFVQATIRRLGGSIWFTSEQDIGTTFYFSIPYDLPMKEEPYA